MAEIVEIKKDGVIQYPITKPEAVIDENGKNILQIINESGGGGGVSKEYVDTKVTELSAEVGKKQDTISDLENIRSGAEKGTTALQSVPDAYATKTDVATAIQTAITNELNAEF